MGLTRWAGVPSQSYGTSRAIRVKEIVNNSVFRTEKLTGNKLIVARPWLDISDMR